MDLSTRDAAQVARLYEGQFLLSRHPRRLPDGWPVHRLGAWSLATSLPVCLLQAPAGQTVGALLGHPIDEAGLVDEKRRVLPVHPSPAQAEDVEDFIYAFGGRFACVIVAEGFARLYLDPGATLAAVYDAEGAASTGTLLAWTHDRPFIAPDPPLGSDEFYFAGLTSDPSIRRLLPNHYLDLGTGEAVRHHLQTSPEPAPESDAPELVRDIVAHLRRNVLAVARARPTYIGITAGRDTRMILACAREAKERIRLFTFDHPRSSTDVAVGRAIARRLGLPHQRVPLAPPSPDLRDRYLMRTGFAGSWGKAREYDEAIERHLESGIAILPGFGGELGRASRTQRALGKGAEMSLDLILRHYRHAETPETPRALEQWLAGFRATEPFSLLAQVYWEHRMGCWASPHLYGVTPRALVVVPFIHRRIVDAMFRLPTGYRLRHQLAADIVRAEWPELLAIPYQQRPGLAGLLHRGAEGIRRRAAALLPGTPARNDRT